jgi:hypothetical protein
MPMRWLTEVADWDTAAEGTSSHDKKAESIALAIMLPKRRPTAPLQVVLTVCQ